MLDSCVSSALRGSTPNSCSFVSLGLPSGWPRSLSTTVASSWLVLLGSLHLTLCSRPVIWFRFSGRRLCTTVDTCSCVCSRSFYRNAHIFNRKVDFWICFIFHPKLRSTGDTFLRQSRRCLGNFTILYVKADLGSPRSGALRPQRLARQQIHVQRQLPVLLDEVVTISCESGSRILRSLSRCFSCVNSVGNPDITS